jgi:hypothetical protein
MLQIYFSSRAEVFGPAAGCSFQAEHRNGPANVYRNVLGDVLANAVFPMLGRAA